MNTKFTNTRLIKRGSQVLYRGGFGSDPQTIAVVTGIEITEFPREKYGDEVDAVTLDATTYSHSITDTGATQTKWMESL
jgi:hypothetical protein